MSLCCGLVAIRFAFEERFEQAATLILVAGVIDGLDGRLARLPIPATAATAAVLVIKVDRRIGESLPSSAGGSAVDAAGGR